jgi:2Fe-2S ferredoxin
VTRLELRVTNAVLVHVEPLGAGVDVDPGESLLEAAWRAGLEWPTLCFGQAECMACRVEVVSGHEGVVPADDDEVDAMRRRLPASQAGPNVRLACQMRVSGPNEVVVRKPGVRRPGDRTG